MAEELLGGILGEEPDEKAELESKSALPGADAFAAAVAHHAALHDPEVSRKTVQFLEQQTELIRIQAQQLRDDHALRIRHLQNQIREENLRRLGLRLRVAFQVLIALIASGIGIGAIIMIRDAVTSRSVVIDPFEVSPNVAAQVPAGKIIAAGVLDVLTKIQAVNHSSVANRALSNAWTNDISVEVPETGISIGELERALKARFGHDQHIEGDIAQSESGGLALTVRGIGVLPKTFAGDARQLDRLVTQAAEYVYSQAEPGLWTAYLSDAGRAEEGIEFARAVYASAGSAERPYILNAWANSLVALGKPGAMSQALLLYQEEKRLKPDYWVAYSNLMFANTALGREEEAVQTGKALEKAAGGRPGRARPINFQNFDQLLWDIPSARRAVAADLDAHHGIGTNTATQGAEILAIAQLDALQHDPDSAALRLATVKIDENSAADVATVAQIRAWVAEERGDFIAAAGYWDEFAKAARDPGVSMSNPQYICFAALSYQKSGQAGKADAALAAVGDLRLTDCERFRGDLLELRGDWGGAQAWYAKAVQLAPSIPTSYYSWGMALAKHGDLTASAEKLAQANRAGPHWADPLKAWGDVLMRQGKRDQALWKYDQALKYAPAWKALQEARAAAAAAAAKH